MLKLRNILNIFLFKKFSFMFEFWSKFLIIDQIIFLIFYEVNYSKASEYQINILSWKTAMNTRSWQDNEIEVGTFRWECLR